MQPARPPSGPAEQKPVQPSFSWPRTSNTNLIPPPPSERWPSHHSAPAGPAPHRPPEAQLPPHPEFRRRRRVAGVSRLATQLGCCAPDSRQPPHPHPHPYPRRGAVGDLFPGVPTPGGPPAPPPAQKGGARGCHAAAAARPGTPRRSDRARRAPEPPRALSGVPRARPIPRPRLPAPVPPPPSPQLLPQRCLLCSSGGGNFLASSWGHRPLGLKLAGDAARGGWGRAESGILAGLGGRVGTRGGSGPRGSPGAHGSRESRRRGRGLGVA